MSVKSIIILLLVVLAIAFAQPAAGGAGTGTTTTIPAKPTTPTVDPDNVYNKDEDPELGFLNHTIIAELQRMLFGGQVLEELILRTDNQLTEELAISAIQGQLFMYSNSLTDPAPKITPLQAKTQLDRLICCLFLNNATSFDIVFASVQKNLPLEFQGVGGLENGLKVTAGKNSRLLAEQIFWAYIQSYGVYLTADKLENLRIENWHRKKAISNLEDYYEWELKIPQNHEIMKNFSQSAQFGNGFRFIHSYINDRQFRARFNAALQKYKTIDQVVVALSTDQNKVLFRELFGKDIAEVQLNAKVLEQYAEQQIINKTIPQKPVKNMSADGAQPPQGGSPFLLIIGSMIIMIIGLTGYRYYRRKEMQKEEEIKSQELNSSQYVNQVSDGSRNL